jgi:hypothetical protein
MTKLSFKPVFNLVVLSAVCLSLAGCSGTLDQQAQSVRISPVSEEYKLTEKLEGKTYILLAETSTGQEQHRYAVSDSLARVLKDSGDAAADEDEMAKKSLVDLSFLGFNGISTMDVSSEGLEVLSFTDLTNKLNEKDLCQRHADMKKFYQQNGMFRKSDLDFLAAEIGADYLVLPCLLDIQRWSKGRFSVGGVRFLQTHIVSGMLGLEIWDTRTGRKVFSAISDITLASDKVKEEPMSMEKAFERAWVGIISELPGWSLPGTLAPIEAELSDSSGEDKHADSHTLTDETVAEAAELDFSS